MPPQLVLPLPDCLHPPQLLCPGFREQLCLGLTDIMQCTGCNDDPGKFILKNLEAGREKVPAALEVTGCAFDQGTSMPRQ